MRHHAYIGIGSNKGAKLENCERALKILARLPETELRDRSSLFTSEPWGTTGEWYINGAAAVDTNLGPWALLRHCQAIEWNMGRRRTENRWEDRVIDLDLLLFDDRVIDDPVLKIPHPELPKRKFVLVPMCEIAPDVVHPLFRVSIAELLARVEDTKQVALIYPNELRL